MLIFPHLSVVDILKIVAAACRHEAILFTDAVKRRSLVSTKLI